MYHVGRRAGLLGLCLLAVGALAVAGGCSSLIAEEQDEEEDNVARAEYFESAALTYYDGARYDLAENQFRKVLAIEPDNKKAQRGLAKSLYQQGTYPKLTEAVAIFEKIVDLDWTHAEFGDRRFEVQSDLAMSYSDLADLFDRDQHGIAARLRNDPTADPAELEPWLQRQVARRNELLQKAIPLYRTVLRRSQENPYALAGLAKAHLQLGNDDLGIQFARRYLKLSQDSQTNWKGQMTSWEEKAGKGNVTEDQRQMFMTKIQGARDKEKKMHLMLASVHMRRGEFGPAVSQYSEVIKLDASVPAAFVERAQAYAALRQYRSAIADLDEYLKITDPQIHRNERVSAVELLDRYQAALNSEGATAVPADAYGRPGRR